MLAPFNLTGRKQMNAVLKQVPVAPVAEFSSIFDGAGCEMFSSGAAPSAGADAQMGDHVGLFSSGAAPMMAADTHSGAQTGLFSSGAAPVVCISTGQRAGLFSSGAAPLTARLHDGTGTHLFSSGA